MSNNDINLGEVAGAIAMSASVGVLKLLYMIRRGRKFRWLDTVLDPGLAVFGGMLAWALAEATGTPDVLQGAFTSLGAWAGPKLIHKLERKYLGGSRLTDTAPAPLGDE